MIKTILIERRICLEPKYLNKNYKEYLFNVLCDQTLFECTNEFGYILKINKITSIKNHEISRSGSEIVFLIQFEADILKPEVNDIMEGEICMIYKYGIFIIILNKQKMLIPSNLLKNYTFDEVNNVFIHSNDNNIIIKKGDIIKAKVVAVQFNKQHFSCFGTLEEKE